jgi:hypothetical protein
LIQLTIADIIVSLSEYDLTEELSIDFLIENLRNKDKYLDLAIALEDNRADWNDGYNIVRNTIESFKIENDKDQDIFDEITSVIYENWDGDGRIFRDINYSYITLYNMVDKKLLEDFNKLKEFKVY